MRTQDRARWAQVAALCGPLAIVALARVVLQTTPSPAQAGPAPVATTPHPSASLPPADPRRTQAADEIRALERLEARSPMDHGPAPAAPDAPAPTDPLAGLSLRSVVGTSEGGFATINGAVYRPGDTIRPGLVLVSIDAKAATVQVRTPDGATHVLVRTRKK